MNRERAVFLLTAIAAALTAAAHLMHGAMIGAAAALCISAAWLAAWRRGSHAMVDFGFAAQLAVAAIGGSAAAIGAAGAALAAWDAMRAERAQRAFTQLEIRADATHTRTRYAMLAAGGGSVVGLLAYAGRALIPDGALSFGALAALVVVCIALIAVAVRATIERNATSPARTHDTVQSG